LEKPDKIFSGKVNATQKNVMLKEIINTEKWANVWVSTMQWIPVEIAFNSVHAFRHQSCKHLCIYLRLCAHMVL